MAWFDFLRKQKKQHKKLSLHPDRSTVLRQSVDKAHTEIGSLQEQVRSLHETLQQHASAIREHTAILDEHKGKFVKLEHLVEQPAVSQPIPIVHQPMAESHASVSPQTCNINCFSPQEKRILSVFFHHPDMALSYTDIARTLNKSPHTIKNQLHQIGIKADLFTKSIDAENRNRFKLKDGIRPEKHLNLG